MGEVGAALRSSGKRGGVRAWRGCRCLTLIMPAVTPAHLNAGALRAQLPLAVPESSRALARGEEKQKA